MSVNGAPSAAGIAPGRPESRIDICNDPADMPRVGATAHKASAAPTEGLLKVSGEPGLKDVRQPSHVFLSLRFCGTLPHAAFRIFATTCLGPAKGTEPSAGFYGLDLY